MQAVRLFQGYLWHPRALALDLKALLPGEVAGARLLWDEVPPPTPFFEDGTPTHTQRFYQLTLLVLTEEPPEALKPLAEEAAEALGEVLEGLPRRWAGFFWRTSGPSRPPGGGVPQARPRARRRRPKGLGRARRPTNPPKRRSPKATRPRPAR